MLNITPSYNFHKFNKTTKPAKNCNVNFKSYTLPKTLEIKGKETTAKIFTNNVNYQTLAQIKTICSHPVLKNLPVRIMPDTHAGKTSVVGFTVPVVGAIIPSLISGDIGCGMLCVKFDNNKQEIDFDKLDKCIKNTISTNHTKMAQGIKKSLNPIEKEINNLCQYKYKTSTDKVLSSIGTIGGGNHFIEIDCDKNGDNYLVIHTGSRHFGKEVHNYHQKIAENQNPYKIKDLSYLTGAEAKDYLNDLKIAIKYSEANRRIIADEILKQMGWKEIESFESIHNYIGADDILRKGAISSHKGEKLIIPLNMRDGAILAKGKGNTDWNCSAPHGAGRQFARSEASELISLEEFKDSMKGIYSNCILKSTIDESPMAYKDANEIIDNISDTTDIETIIKPIYNFKD